MRSYDSVVRFDMWQGDLEPALKMKLTGGIPLPEGATVQFVMAQAGGPKRVAANAVVDDPTVPTVHYVWQEGDTDVPGIYRAVMRVLIGGVLPGTFPSSEPFYVVIRRAL